MSREIKFRTYEHGKMHTLSAYDLGPYLEDNVAPVMQYTGLKDKNGREKYQDDILQTNGVDGKLLWQIVWRELDVLSGFDYEPVGHSFSCVHNEVDEYGEIIGNIMENPELLK